MVYLDFCFLFALCICLLELLEQTMSCLQLQLLNLDERIVSLRRPLLLRPVCKELQNHHQQNHLQQLRLQSPSQCQQRQQHQQLPNQPIILAANTAKTTTITLLTAETLTHSTTSRNAFSATAATLVNNLRDRHKKTAK